MRRSGVGLGVGVGLERRDGHKGEAVPLEDARLVRVRVRVRARVRARAYAKLTST